MSLWRRLFKKDQASRTVAKPLSLKEQYQRKVQLYLEILTAANAALEIMAQMQVRLQDKEYFSPAYLQLNCAMVLDQARRVIQSLKNFTGNQELAIAGVFERIAQEINAEFTLFSEKLDPSTALPFEGHTLATPELVGSGVAYPAKEDAGEALSIKAVWGWWPAVQEGTVRARRYRVARGLVTEFTSPATGPQEHWLTYHRDQGFVREPLPQDLQEQPCLQEGEAQKIAEYYGLLKARCPNLQELEWGLGPNREVVILRSLPHEQPSFQEAPGQTAAGEALFSHGLTIYPGVAAGPACRLDVNQAPESPEVPAGAVLFANKPALSLAPFLPNLAALVAETGEPHSHLAFLAREHRLPTIFALGEDTSRVPEAMIVAVDAGTLQIWAGPLPGQLTPAQEARAPEILAHTLLERLSPRLFSLDQALLTRPPAPEACQSIHDILYYASAVRIKEMFCYSLRGEIDRKSAVNLVTGRLVPIVVIDAGGGLSAQTPSATFEEVTSIPFHAFLEGMMSIPWPKARPLDVKGFISVIGTTSATPGAEDQLRKISFALLAREYMNFSLCLGYHASTIEAFVGANLDNNYIRFHYEGGAASLDRRLRRLQLIGEILVQLGFKVTVTGDLLDGLLTGEPGPRLLEKLAILGRLEVFTKQMDMVMSDDAAVSGHVTLF
ncbi:MAG: PEP-utilizing enzyme, partial [Desulfobaccales bacterium]